MDGECRSSPYNKLVQALIMWYDQLLFIRQREKQKLQMISIGTGGDSEWLNRREAVDHKCHGIDPPNPKRGSGRHGLVKEELHDVPGE